MQVAIPRRPYRYRRLGPNNDVMMIKRQQKSVLCIICTTLIIISRLDIGSAFLGINNSIVRSHYFSPADDNLRKTTPRTLSSSRAATTTTTTSSTGEGGASALAVVPPGILGPPEPLGSLGVGEHVNAFRSVRKNDDDGEEESVEKVQFAIERVGRTPDVFRLRNFATPHECASIRSAAEASGMERAETVTEDDASSRKNCSVAWIPPGREGDGAGAGAGVGGGIVVADLASSIANIFLSGDVLSHPSAGAEDMQVLRYGTGGEFVHHHDGEPRILTVIYYVNGVGGTWFPLARTVTDDEDAMGECREPANKSQALDMVEGLEPGKDGLLVRGAGSPRSDDADYARREENEHVAWVNQGDAIAFYGYKDDGSGELDWRSIHCGLPTTEEEGTKWIANHWFRLNVLTDL